MLLDGKPNHAGSNFSVACLFVPSSWAIRYLLFHIGQLYGRAKAYCSRPKLLWWPEVWRRSYVSCRRISSHNTFVQLLEPYARREHNSFRAGSPVPPAAEARNPPVLKLPRIQEPEPRHSLEAAGSTESGLSAAQAAAEAGECSPEPATTIRPVRNLARIIRGKTKARVGCRVEPGISDCLSSVLVCLIVKGFVSRCFDFEGTKNSGVTFRGFQRSRLRCSREQLYPSESSALECS